MLVSFASSFAQAAEDEFSLKGGETIVFFGDSITQAGIYVEYVEAYLRTRFPAKTFRVINRGISSETISGTSEADHQPRRPNAHDRFTRDIASCKPDIVVACFGMNDGNYFPFEPVRFAEFQAGINHLIERTRDEAKAKIALMTPPPFDPYRRKASDPKAREFGYKFPAIDYDNTLARYSQWELTLRDKAIVVADVHTAMNDHLRRRRAEKVSFALQNDAVHPDATGHGLMAQTLLEAWRAPAVCAEARIDAAKLRAEAGDVTSLRRDGNALCWTWKTPLPMPMDSRWDTESIALEKVADRLNRYRLAATHLPAARYRLIADGKAIAEVNRDELEKGLNLLDYPTFPTIALSQKALSLVQERNKMSYTAWRRNIAAPKGTDPKGRTGDSVEGERRTAEIETNLLELCRPRNIQIELVPL
jgi:lysophospholipase L1-like esterase